jgi:hypothetical protein
MARWSLRDELLRRNHPAGDGCVAVSPSYILQAGLPYTISRSAVIIDTDVRDAPERYHEEEFARRLLTVVADAVPPDGWVIAPAGDEALHRMVLDAGCRLAVFGSGPKGKRGAVGAHLAEASATVDGEEIEIEHAGRRWNAGRMHEDSPVAVQLAAALLSELSPHEQLQPRSGDGAQL